MSDAWDGRGPSVHPDAERQGSHRVHRDLASRAGPDALGRYKSGGLARGWTDATACPDAERPEPAERERRDAALSEPPYRDEAEQRALRQVVQLNWVLAEDAAAGHWMAQRDCPDQRTVRRVARAWKATRGAEPGAVSESQEQSRDELGRGIRLDGTVDQKAHGRVSSRVLDFHPFPEEAVGEVRRGLESTAPHQERDAMESLDPETQAVPAVRASQLAARQEPVTRERLPLEPLPQKAAAQTAEPELPQEPELEPEPVQVDAVQLDAV